MNESAERSKVPRQLADTFANFIVMMMMIMITVLMMMIIIMLFFVDTTLSLKIGVVQYLRLDRTS